jgi:hypothetical protein
MPVSSTAAAVLYAGNLYRRSSLRTAPLRLLTVGLLAATLMFMNVIAWKFRNVIIIQFDLC